MNVSDWTNGLAASDDRGGRATQANRRPRLGASWRNRRRAGAGDLDQALASPPTWPTDVR